MCASPALALPAVAGVLCLSDDGEVHTSTTVTTAPVYTYSKSHSFREPRGASAHNNYTTNSSSSGGGGVQTAGPGKVAAQLPSAFRARRAPTVSG